MQRHTLTAKEAGLAHQVAQSAMHVNLPVASEHKHWSPHVDDMARRRVE